MKEERKRVFLIVLDSLGIGGADDAADFSDEGSDTLRSIYLSKYFHAPNLSKLGIFNIDENDYGEKAKNPIGNFARGIPSVSSIFRMVFALLTGSYPESGNLEHKLRINVISSSALAMIKCKHGQLLKDLSKRFLIGADLEKEYANEKESGAFDRYIYRGGGFFLRRRCVCAVGSGSHRDGPSADARCADHVDAGGIG